MTKLQNFRHETTALNKGRCFQASYLAKENSNALLAMRGRTKTGLSLLARKSIAVSGRKL